MSLVLVAGGCDGGNSTADAGGDAAPDGGATRTCRPGSDYLPGAPAFVDRTEAWGLAGVHGNSLAVADLDGDGWPDLAVSRGATYDRVPGNVYFNRANADGTRRFEDRSADSMLYRVRGSDELARSASFTRFGDVDGDGDLDAFTAIFPYLTDPTRTPLDDASEVLLNDGAGTFALTEPTITQWTTPLTSDGFFFDQDLDGALDLALGYWWVQPAFTRPYGSQPQLFRGNGAGGFTDATEAAGMFLEGSSAAVREGRQPRPLFSFQMCDVDGNGRHDIVGAAYGRMYNELYLADGDVFREVGATTMVGSDDRRDYCDDWSFQCYCRSRASDPYCACASGSTVPLAYCTGFGRTEADGRGWIPGSSDQPINLGGNTFSYACADFDADGDLDLYESNIRHPDVGSSSDPSELLVNDGSGNFTRPGRETMGLVPPIDLATTDEGGQQSATLDFDNDGRLDIYLAGSPYPSNRGWLFHQRSEGTLQFEWVGADAGFHHACANGAAIADLDHDGDLDVIVGTYGCNDPARSPDYTPPENQPVRVYENVSNENNFVSIRLRGLGAGGGANRFGIGARIRLTAGGVTQTRVLQTSSQNASFEPEAFFGLGATCDVDRVEITWPNESLGTEVVMSPLANHRLEIREGSDEVGYLE